MSEDRSIKRGVRVALGVVGTALLAAAAVSACTQEQQQEAPAGPGVAPAGVARAPVADVPAGFTRLAHGVHPLARPEFDRGPLDPAKRIANLSMALKLSPAQRADREALKADLINPGSPSYRKFLTPKEYAARFGAPRATIERAKSWLASQGLEVHEDSPLGARVTFSGTVEKLQAAFQTEMRQYEVGGEMHYAMQRAPAMPADLSGAVAEISNTHDFHPKPMLKLPKNPEYKTGTNTGFAPPDWANVYNAAPLYTTGIGGKKIDGTGVTIAVVGVAQFATSDITAWRTTFNLGPTNLVTTLVPNTGGAAAGTGGAGFEAVLDAEWSGSTAPGANINFVMVGNMDQNVDDASYYAIENNLGSVLSESFGGCEGYYLQAGITGADQNIIDIYGSAANVLGITYVAASGDAGATTCLQGGGTLAGVWVSLPAAYPGVTSVGGTQFPTGSLSGSPYFLAYSTAETAWNESSSSASPAAGGGGLSMLFSRPFYQSGVPTCGETGTIPVTGINPDQQRMVPDISFTSAEGSGTYPLFVECTINAGAQDCSRIGGKPQFLAAGGTSFATPAFAGVVALMNQVAGGRLGNINPMLYNLAGSAPTAFHDIITGSNAISCKSTDPGCGTGGFYGFPAAKSYDCATGLGSLNVYNLVSTAAGMAPTTTALVLNPTSTMEGATVGFTATVTVPTPNASALGGLVAFSFQTYDQNMNPDLSWVLGTGAITGGTTAGGTATFSGIVPPGLVKPGMQSVDLVAAYGGDAAHLPSVSVKVPLTFAPLNFAIVPAMPTAPTGGTINFMTTGGVPPVKWLTGADNTCDVNNNCSTLDEKTGVFVAGPVAGTVDVFAIDTDGAEAMVTVNVGGASSSSSSSGTTTSSSSSSTTTSSSGTTTSSSSSSTTASSSSSSTTTSSSSSSGTTTSSSSSSGTTTSSSSSSGTTTTSSSSTGGGTGGAGATSSSTSSSSGGGSTPGGKSGCGCKTAGDDASSSTSLSAFGLLALAGVMRGRRRRRAHAA